MPPSLSSKARGEWAELVFLQEARRRGFLVSKPYGDTAPYDVLLDNGRRIFRVQVKSVGTATNGGYRINAGSGARMKRPYKLGEIDFIAAYIIPLDLWYIIPTRAFVPRISVALFPRGLRGKYEEYCKAWKLFGRPNFVR